MYPNPANEKITLQLTNDLLSSYAIMDMKGSTLLSEEAISGTQKTINVSTLSQGIYLIKVTTENNNSFVKKLVVR